MSTVLYNDNDQHACAWLRELITAGELPPGIVDPRSIHDLTPDDLAPYRHVHLFAGIGGWPYALRLAGWPDNVPVWTGSCPCQPFSCAGKQLGETDPRHLWPEFYRLIKACRPPTVFGEQVASPLGYDWLNQVAFDLDGLGYAVGSANLPAAGAGAPHLRHRLFWVASYADHDHANRRSSFVQVWRSVGQEEVEENLRRARAQWTTQPRPVALANGVSNRVAVLNGYGNAIVPQVAAEFIAAFIEAVNAQSL